MVMLLGMLTTLLYREILVMKFRGLLRSEEIGIRTRSVQTLSYSFSSSSTCQKQNQLSIRFMYCQINNVLVARNRI